MIRRVAAGALLAATLAAAAAAPADPVADWLTHEGERWTPATLHGTPLPPADLVVAADGSGTHTSLQAAFDAVPARGATARRTTIVVRPGTYRERPCLREKAPVLLAGEAADAAAVRIVAAVSHATPKAPSADAHACHAHQGHAVHGTSGSATLWVVGSDVQLRHLTVENEARDAQAVALALRGDRIQLDDVRLLGWQDTLLLRRPAPPSTEAAAGTAGRVHIAHSVIAGDVDFVFGDATAVITDSTLLSRAGRRSGGHVLAPSTRPGQRGFLVVDSRFAAEPGVAAGSVSLGRAWDEGVPAGQWQAGRSPNGEAVVRGSALGPHLAGWAASTARRPFDPAVNRLVAEGNTADADDPARAPLAAGDGWASQEGGTRGGADALPRDVHTVRSAAELRAALAAHGRPRIVRVAAFIALGGPEEAFRDPAFDRAAFERLYDPATWGRRAAEGPLEDARRRSAAAQRAQVVLRVPSRTTLIGAAPGAGLHGGMLLLERVSDVIVRGLRLSDAFDHFPAWDPDDNRQGEWNSLYDNLALVGATRVWIDRCTFDDGERPDGSARTVFGRRVQHHDGLLDITRESDLVTVSHNHFKPHDKTSLVGGSDRHVSDEGRLRVTYRHNLWDGVLERAPRVRHGRVHLVGNVYRVPDAVSYGYSIGLGLRSSVLAEHNHWLTPGLAPERLVRLLGGTRFSDRGSVLDGRPVSLLQALRATPAGAALEPDIGWAPPYPPPTHGQPELVNWVLRHAGPAGLIR